MKKVLAACFLISLILICAVGAQADSSGSCGTNARWSYSNGVLTISGSGAMSNYTDGKQPWNSVATKVQTVQVEEGITSIGDYAFKGMSSLTSVQLPEGIKTIGKYAIQSCSALQEIVIP